MMSSNITTQTTTIVKTQTGILGSVIFNKALASGVVAIYDGVDATGTLIGTITFPATLLNHPAPYVYNRGVNKGITIVTSGANQDITVTYDINKF